MHDKVEPQSVGRSVGRPVGRSVVGQVLMRLRNLMGGGQAVKKLIRPKIPVFLMVGQDCM